MQSTGAAERFLNDIQGWAGAYRRAVISFLAVRQPAGSHVVAAQMDLRTAEDEAYGIEPAVLETSRLLFTRAILPINERGLASLIREAIDEGKLPAQLDGRLAGSNSNLRKTFYRYHHPQLPAGARVPTVVVTSDDRAAILPFSEFDDHDWELRAADPPFLGLSEAMDAFGLPRLQSSDNYCQLVVAAESPAIVDATSEIRDGVLRLSCLASRAIDIAEIRIGLRLFSPVRPESLPRLTRKTLDRLEWRAERWSEARNRLSAEIPIEDARIAQIFLSYRGMALHDLFVMDAHRSLNFRYTIHGAFDKNLDNLRRLMEPAQSAEENFEHGIALVLNLLGFSTALHGQAYRLKDAGVDIVATTPAGKIAFVECTTALPNHKSKLSNLCRRVSQATQELAVHGIQSAILPVIVTALPKAVIESEIENMERLGVAYATRESILDALNRVRFHVNPEQLFNDIQTNVAEAKARRQRG
jgi:hypothetical protein